MTWEEKLAACQALAECTVRMRQPGNWYVSHRVEIKSGPVLKGNYGSGPTPQEAVVEHWHILTTIKPDERIVINAGGENRREVVWNGFMWEDRP